LIGDELKDLHFSASAELSNKDLDAFLQEDSIPKVHISLDSFGVELPVYAGISDLKGSLTLAPDTIIMHHLGAAIGESRFRLKGTVTNYRAIASKDSGKVVMLDFALDSDMLTAEELLTYRDTFLLPESYKTEYLKNFRIAGSMEIPAYGLIADSVPTDFVLSISDLGWKLRYYPFEFNDFRLSLSKEKDSLIIHDFRGKLGESNLQLSANLGNISDSLIENIHGNMVLQSDLLDFNELLSYQAPAIKSDIKPRDSSQTKEPLRLDQVDYPDFHFTLNLGEIRFEDYKIIGMNGVLQSSTHKIIYLDQLITTTASGGRMKFNGQFNVSSPYYYTFSADLDLDDVDINDLDLVLQSGDTVTRLSDTFQGLISADGLAEVFITPDMKIDMSTTTAMFNLRLVNGTLINFTPLQAAGKFLDNKNLNHVRFAMLRNSFTLVDSRITIPLMNVESTIGQLRLEGEQGLDNSYLYLIRVPTTMVKEAVISRLTRSNNKEEVDQIKELKLGKVVNMTAWSNGVDSDFKLGDRRERFMNR
jgi:hypothetical protein